MKKICNTCNLEKEISFFFKKSSNKDGFNHKCKECYNKYYRDYYLENSEKIQARHKEYDRLNVEKNRLRKQKYRKINKKNMKIKRAFYYEKNREKFKIYAKNNRERINYNSKQRRKNSVLIKLSQLIRNRLNYKLKTLGKKRQRTFLDFIGCSLEDLKLHLEKQFKPGMTWDNWGVFGWHIDHIKPLASAKTEEEMYNLCHYTNLQPLWAKDNLKKGDSHEP